MAPKTRVVACVWMAAEETLELITNELKPGWVVEATGVSRSLKSNDRMTFVAMVRNPAGVFEANQPESSKAGALQSRPSESLVGTKTRAGAPRASRVVGAPVCRPVPKETL